MEVPARYSKCHRQHINLWSTPEERRERYQLARNLGFNSYEATRMRDWRTETIRKAYAAYQFIQEYFMNEWAEEQRLSTQGLEAAV